MFYNNLKFLHILSATLLITSMAYCVYLWRYQMQSSKSFVRIQAQTMTIIIPCCLIQLISGFNMISLYKHQFSRVWIAGNVIGLIVIMGSWLSFSYFLLLSQQLLKTSHPPSSEKNNFRGIQSAMLLLCGIALFSLIFLMANKYVNY